MTREDNAARYRHVPDVVVLPGSAGTGPGGKPPVRIFLGTEDGQWRAERIFFFSIERVRDRDRTYEVHLMKNLKGFRRRGWRTGFTNYRFAIPELAGFQGRAIYNDVDQIYLTDPARLFDQVMDGHGYLSVSPQDTSVMLLDCAAMGDWWTLRKAIDGRKSELIREPAAQPGVWGPLDGAWNARDEEFALGESQLLHFTALHRQPWRPFPEHYSYHPHPHGDIWFHLERKADTQGYQVFGPDCPSPQFEAALTRRGVPPTARQSESVRGFLRGLPVRTVLSVIPAHGEASMRPVGWPRELETGECPVDRLAADSRRFDAVVAAAVLEDCPAEDVPWLLEECFEHASMAVCVAVRGGAVPGREADVNVKRAVRTVAWWQQQLTVVAARHPRIAWQLDADGTGPISTWRAEGLRDRPPRVWALEGRRAGDNAQLHRLGEALGWPVEHKKLIFTACHLLPNAVLGASLANVKKQSRQALAPPWPEIVVAIGKRGTAAARWIKKQSGGYTRLVHLGRPWARLDVFDLIITTPQYRLPARDNVLHNALPLTGIDAGGMARQGAALEPSFQGLARPRIALLVGGSSWSYAFRPNAARRLGETASRHVRKAGGSLLVITSPRTGARAADALFAAIDAPHRGSRYEDGGDANPYTDYLAVADEIMVTSDSASMIADAVATGKPVRILDIPERLAGRLAARLRDVLARLRGRTYRGTPRQQGPLSRFHDALVARGALTPARDLRCLHRLLARRGLLQAGAGRPCSTDLAREELDYTVRCVRALFSRGRPVAPSVDSRPAMAGGSQFTGRPRNVQ